MGVGSTTRLKCDRVDGRVCELVWLGVLTGLLRSQWLCVGCGTCCLILGI